MDNTNTADNLKGLADQEKSEVDQQEGLTKDAASKVEVEVAVAKKRQEAKSAWEEGEKQYLKEQKEQAEREAQSLKNWHGMIDAFGVVCNAYHEEYMEKVQRVKDSLAERTLQPEDLREKLKALEVDTYYLDAIEEEQGNREAIMDYLQEHPDYVFGEDSDKASNKSDEMALAVDAEKNSVVEGEETKVPEGAEAKVTEHNFILVQMTPRVTIHVPFGQESTVQDIIDAVAPSTKINKNRLVLVHEDKHLDSAQLIVDTPIKKGDVVTVKKIKSKSSPHTFPGYFIKVVNLMPRVSAQTRSGANGSLETLLAVKSDMSVHELAAKVVAKWNITAPFALFVDDMRIFDYTKTLEDTGVGDGAKVDVKMTGLVGGGTGSDGIKDSERFFDCVFCGKMCVGWGHNPRPVFNEGRCCDKCNETEVIRARIYQIVLQHRAQHPEDEMDEESTVGVEESKEEED